MGLSPREPKRTYRASNNGNDDEREDKHKKNNAEPPLKPHLSEWGTSANVRVTRTQQQFLTKLILSFAGAIL